MFSGSTFNTATERQTLDYSNLFDLNHTLNNQTNGSQQQEILDIKII